MAAMVSSLAAAGCSGEMNLHHRAMAEKQMAKAKEGQDCMLAADAVQQVASAFEMHQQRSFSEVLEGNAGWSREDQDLLLRLMAEKEAICRSRS